MFGNAYQNGSCLDVWDVKVDPSKNPFYRQLAKVSHSNARTFDKQAKSYLLTLQGQNSKLTLPADDAKALSLHQRYLVLQIFIPIGFQWWLQLGMTDLSGSKRRINITTTQGKQEGKYFSYRYPTQVTKGSWLFMGIDIYSFMDVFKGQTFRSLDHVVVGSCCRLRRIFTMKEFVEYEIPNGFWLSQELPQRIELIAYQDPAKSMLPNRHMANSLSPPREDIKKSLSQKRDVNHSDISPQKKSPKVSHPGGRSGQIIDKAKQKLQRLKREQQMIFRQSHQLEINSRSPGKVPYLQKQSIIARNDAKLNPILPPILETEHKSKQLKSKLPPLDRSFKEDQALNIQESQPLTPPQEALQYSRHFEQSKQENSEDRWAQTKSKRPSRAPALSIGKSMHNARGVQPSNFPSTVITQQNGKEVMVQERSLQLQLIFDEMAGCYYHPESNTYYELRK